MSKKIELQLCPKCGAPAKLHRYNNKYQYECDMCWTKGHRCTTEEEAAESWNAIKPKPELQQCPNCGCSAEIHNRNHKYWYECNSCWTQGDKCASVEDARKSWNELKPRPQKTNLEVLQEFDSKHMAVFLASWAREHVDWQCDNDGGLQYWLESPADYQIKELAAMEFED